MVIINTRTRLRQQLLVSLLMAVGMLTLLLVVKTTGMPGKVQASMSIIRHPQKILATAVTPVPKGPASIWLEDR
jgi:hypothetical protein